jgi:hypothetical protein
MKPCYVELYYPDAQKPFWHGPMLYATVKGLLAATKRYSGPLIFRVLAPTNATQDELDSLERLGAVRI